jgi:hypothetical protein
MELVLGLGVTGPEHTCTTRRHNHGVYGYVANTLATRRRLTVWIWFLFFTFHVLTFNWE